MSFDDFAHKNVGLSTRQTDKIMMASAVYPFVLLLACVGCAHRTAVATVPWQQIEDLDPKAAVPDSCRLLGTIEASDGLVRHRENEYDATMRRLRKKGWPPRWQPNPGNGNNVDYLDAYSRVGDSDFGHGVAL
jgi:hypothetical protein